MGPVGVAVPGASKSWDANLWQAHVKFFAFHVASVPSCESVVLEGLSEFVTFWSEEGLHGVLGAEEVDMGS